MADEFKKEEIVDTYSQHVAYHQSYHSDCSECYKERRAINAWKTVNLQNTIKTLGDINKAIYGVNPYV